MISKAYIDKQATLCYSCFVYSASHPRRVRNSFPGLTPSLCPALVPPASVSSRSLVSKSFPYLVTSLLPYFLFSKSFNCNTYGSPCKCCKQKTYGLAKSFRCNTYKKPGEGFPILEPTFRCVPALLPYFHTSLFRPVPTGSNRPARSLDFPPVSFAVADLYIEAVPVQGEAMNEITVWIQSNWFELGNLLCQFIFLAAGIWFARKILRTLRASQEQAGALLKLSVTGAISERQSSSAANGGSFANASPYWLTPGELPPGDPTHPPQTGSTQQPSNGHGLMAWLDEPMSHGDIAPWR